MRPQPRALPLLLVVPALAACTVQVDSYDQGSPAGPAPTSLRDVRIDQSFTFASTRGINVLININVKGATSNKPFPIEIYNIRNEKIIEAALPEGGVFSTDFPLPLGDHEIIVKLDDKEQIVTVGDDNIARVTFK